MNCDILYFKYILLSVIHSIQLFLFHLVSPLSILFDMWLLLNIVKMTTNQEIDLWKNTHQSQGYCNATLMREDSFKLAERHTNTIHETVKTIYNHHVSPHVVKHVVPLIDQHVVPLIDQHIRPFYVDHVSPVVKNVLVKEYATDMRARAASMAEQESAAVLEFMQGQQWFDQLPGGVVAYLDRTSRDGGGGPAVDGVCRGMLFLFLVAFRRPLVYRPIGMAVSVLWFFCPLRWLFVILGVGKKKKKQKVAKEAVSAVSKKLKKKAKVY